MTISTALSIRPGSSPLLTGAPSVTGDGAMFAALIGGGLFKPMPILAPADPAASGGQAGAVVGNPLPFKAPEASPDILVAQPATIPAAGLPGATLPLSEPDLAPDILVDPSTPLPPASTSDQSQVTDDAVSLRSPRARFRFANVVTTPVVADGTMPSVLPTEPERRTDASASAERPVPLAEIDGAPDILIDPSAPATVLPVDDRPRTLADPTASDPLGGVAGGDATLTMPDMAPDILVAQEMPVTATPVGDRARPRDDAAAADRVTTRIRSAKAMTAPGVRGPVTTDTAPNGPTGRAASTPADHLAAAALERDAATSVPIVEPTSPALPAATPVAVEAIISAPGPVVAAVPAPPASFSEGAPSSRRERPAGPVAVPIATRLPTGPAGLSLNTPTPTDLAPISSPPPFAPAAVTTPPPLSADGEVGASIGPNRIPLQHQQVTPEPAGRAPLTAGAGSLAAVPALPASPSSVPISAGAVAPAGELFAAAIHAAGRSTFDPPGDAAPIAPPMTASAIAAAAPTGGNADRSLDLGHPGWPGAMIEHIERLRDAADAVDTRIRVVPDALGGIDVSLRRHDDGVRVTLAADRPATQAILAEARPQLDAMAEARGIRLADAATGSTAGGLGGDPSTAQRQPRPAPFIPAAPAPAAAGDTPDPADGRVA